jgi:hypothetical protein
MKIFRSFVLFIWVGTSIFEVGCVAGNGIEFDVKNQRIHSLSSPLRYFMIKQSGNLYFLKARDGNGLRHTFDFSKDTANYYIESAYPNKLHKELVLKKNEVIEITNLSIPDATPFKIKLIIDSCGKTSETQGQM